MKLLVVEDDPGLRTSLLRLLGQWGYGAEAAADGSQAEAWLEREPFDLVLLDLGLPDRDGLALCHRLRQRPGQQPLVLMLTARDGRLDKLRGLDSGADDYVVKPFDPELLQARIRALLRRANRPLRSALIWGPLLLHPGQSTVWIDGRALELTRKEALLLELLLQGQGKSCSKAELLHGCGDGRRDVGEDTIRTHMRNLRQKLGTAGCPPDLIETVYGLGYRLTPATAA
jgi:DNA-binding response OmpR family regulator